MKPARVGGFSLYQLAGLNKAKPSKQWNNHCQRVAKCLAFFVDRFDAQPKIKPDAQMAPDDDNQRRLLPKIPIVEIEKRNCVIIK